MVKDIAKITGITAIGFVLAISLSSCADIGDEGPSGTQQTATMTQTQTQTETQALKEDTIKVGAILPLTGDKAAYGEQMQKVAQIALDSINAGGGVNGKKLEFIWEDGKCNGNDASIAANKLIHDDQVKIIYGGFCNTETLAIAPVAESSHVVVLSPASSSPEISNAGDYIFRNYPSDAIQGRVLADAAQKEGFKKVGVVVEQNEYTQGIEKAFEDELKQRGVDVVVETYKSDTGDFGSALSRLKSAAVDALLVDTQTPAKADLVFKQLEAMKWEVKLLGNDVVAGYPDLIAKYSKLVEGMVLAEFTYDQTNPDFKKLAAKFKETAGKDLPFKTYASTCYDAVYLIKEALEKAGNDADGVKNYLAGVHDRKGLAGILSFDENGDPSTGHQLEIVKAGKVTAY